MKLYLMRHGAALSVGAPGVGTDAERPLSDEGKAKTREVARGLAAIDVRPDVIATSPLVRARETAEIVAHGLKTPPPELCDFLGPGGRGGDAIGWLRQGAPESAMFVGHLPDIAEMLGMYTAGIPSAGVLFKKSAVACVDFEDDPGVGRGSLVWFLPPSILRRLGQ